MNIERWNKFTLHQKLGNIGSEVARARLWDDKKDILARNMSLHRILEMLDATLEGNIPMSAKKELNKTKELVSGWHANSKDIEYSPSLLEEYFTQFAYLI
ncbi:MAG: hypothetical protein P4L74_04250 [Candidatus Doudnabacteria bacterium]|nr:hypothetical protein [Candidatus Doudnabacteria bacterium]